MAQVSRLSCLVAASLVATSGAVRLEGNVNDILIDQLSDDTGPQLWRFDFDPIPGIVVDLSTGRVTQVTGQAETFGVQEGWYVYKLDHYYKWSVGRWNSLVSSGTRFAITFSENRYTPFNCHNLPEEWVDNRNRGCSYYASHQMCTTFGTEGEGFPVCKVWQLGCREKTLDTYAKNGVSAAEACCTCGGGWDPNGEPATTTTTTTTTEAPTSAPTPEPTAAPTPAPTPAAVPTNAQVSPHPRTSPGEGWECHDEVWVDSLGYDCSHYETHGWCAHTHLRQYADEKGTSAYEACCACQGGVFKEGPAQLHAAKEGGASTMRAASGLLMVLVFGGLL